MQEGDKRSKKKNTDGDPPARLKPRPGESEEEREELRQINEDYGDHVVVTFGSLAGEVVLPRDPGLSLLFAFWTKGMRECKDSSRKQLCHLDAIELVDGSSAALVDENGKITPTACAYKMVADYLAKKWKEDRELDEMSITPRWYMYDGAYKGQTIRSRIGDRLREYKARTGNGAIVRERLRVAHALGLTKLVAGLTKDLFRPKWLLDESNYHELHANYQGIGRFPKPPPVLGRTEASKFFTLEWMLTDEEKKEIDEKYPFMAKMQTGKWTYNHKR